MLLPDGHGRAGDCRRLALCLACHPTLALPERLFDLLAGVGDRPGYFLLVFDDLPRQHGEREGFLDGVAQRLGIEAERERPPAPGLLLELIVDPLVQRLILRAA